MASAFETNRQREEIKKAYGNSASWNTKVNLMQPDQVTAVYLRLKSQGRIK